MNAHKIERVTMNDESLAAHLDMLMRNKHTILSVTPTATVHHDPVWQSTYQIISRNEQVASLSNRFGTGKRG